MLIPKKTRASVPHGGQPFRAADPNRRLGCPDRLALHTQRQIPPPHAGPGSKAASRLSNLSAPHCYDAAKETGPPHCYPPGRMTESAGRDWPPGMSRSARQVDSNGSNPIRQAQVEIF